MVTGGCVNDVPVNSDRAKQSSTDMYELLNVAIISGVPPHEVRIKVDHVVVFSVSWF